MCSVKIKISTCGMKNENLGLMRMEKYTVNLTTNGIANENSIALWKKKPRRAFIELSNAGQIS